jgi:signal peptidase I
MNVLIVLLIPLAAIVLMIRALVFQPFDTPSTSMAPTLVEGDRFMVAKFAYGYSRFSFPLSPAFSGRILGAQPAYGDVVVFRLPRDNATDYIKRVVGLPGDRIQMKDGVLHINGQAVVREPVFSGEACKRFRERLPNGVSHDILDCVDNGFYDSTLEYRVPAGHYFMMGDNRDNSTDSRVLNQVGYVPFENLVGRFAFVYASGNGE